MLIKKEEEAAYIDGCGFFGRFFHVLLPLSRTGIVTAATFEFLTCWNEFVFAYTFTSSKKLQTVTLGLRDFVGMYGATDWGRTFTTIFLTILPTFILYFFLGKYMLAGMTDGAVQG